MHVRIDPRGFGSLTAYVAAHPMPYRRADLIGLWSTHQFDAARRRGDLVRILPGVFCARGYASDPSLQARAVSMWRDDAIVTGHSALALHSGDWPAPPMIHVAVPRESNVVRWPGVRISYRSDLPRSNLLAGARVAVAECALVDAWIDAEDVHRTDLFYQALWRHVVHPKKLLREVDSRRRVADRAALVLLASEACAGRHSWLESFARREVFVGPEFGAFEYQVEISTHHGKRRADMCQLGARVIVELDGRRDHESVAGVQRDRQRDAELAAAGYVTLRFGYRELRDRPQWCRRVVLDAIQPRLRSQPRW